MASTSNLSSEHGRIDISRSSPMDWSPAHPSSPHPVSPIPAPRDIKRTAAQAQLDEDPDRDIVQPRTDIRAQRLSQSGSHANHSFSQSSISGQHGYGATQSAYFPNSQSSVPRPHGHQANQSASSHFNSRLSSSLQHNFGLSRPSVDPQATATQQHGYRPSRMSHSSSLRAGSFIPQQHGYRAPRRFSSLNSRSFDPQQRNLGEIHSLSHQNARSSILQQHGYGPTHPSSRLNPQPSTFQNRTHGTTHSSSRPISQTSAPQPHNYASTQSASYSNPQDPIAQGYGHDITHPSSHPNNQLPDSQQHGSRVPHSVSERSSQSSIPHQHDHGATSSQPYPSVSRLETGSSASQPHPRNNWLGSMMYPPPIPDEAPHPFMPYKHFRPTPYNPVPHIFPDSCYPDYKAKLEAERSLKESYKLPHDVPGEWPESLNESSIVYRHQQPDDTVLTRTFTRVARVTNTCKRRCIVIKEYVNTTANQVGTAARHINGKVASGARHVTRTVATTARQAIPLARDLHNFFHTGTNVSMHTIVRAVRSAQRLGTIAHQRLKDTRVHVGYVDPITEDTHDRVQLHIYSSQELERVREERRQEQLRLEVIETEARRQAEFARERALQTERLAAERASRLEELLRAIQAPAQESGANAPVNVVANEATTEIDSQDVLLVDEDEGSETFMQGIIAESTRLEEDEVDDYSPSYQLERDLQGTINKTVDDEVVMQTTPKVEEKEEVAVVEAEQEAVMRTVDDPSSFFGSEFFDTLVLPTDDEPMSSPKATDETPYKPTKEQEAAQQPLPNLGAASEADSTRRTRYQEKKAREEEAARQLEAELKRKPFAPLNDEQEADVAEVLMKGFKSFSPGELARVVPTGRSSADGTEGWLNDEVVNEYMKLITAHGNSKHVETANTEGIKYAAFSSFWYTTIRDKGYAGVSRWTRRAKIMSTKQLELMKSIYVPINSGSHWTLLAIRPASKTVSYYDSLNGSGPGPIDAAKMWLRAELGAAYDENEWTFNPRCPSPRQNNSKDCGVFTVTTAKMLTLGIEPVGAYGPSDIPLVRRKMVLELLEGGLV